MVFGFGLLTSLISAIIGIGLNLLKLRYVFSTSTLNNEFENFSLPADGINYFSWGFVLVLVVNAVLIAVLLWFPRQRQKDIIVSTQQRS
jgi:cell division protein FtsX